MQIHISLEILLINILYMYIKSAKQKSFQNMTEIYQAKKALIVKRGYYLIREIISILSSSVNNKNLYVSNNSGSKYTIPTL